MPILSAELDAYADLAIKTGRSLETVLMLFEENRAHELFDDDGNLIRHTGMPGELALRIVQLEAMKW